MNKKPLVIISGPTAAGKTDLSVSLAKLINGEIISADSMQVYKGFDIGTAKTTSEEMSGIKHYLIDELEPDEEFNIFEFKTRAEKYINEIVSKGKIPVIVGGTGFYIQSVIYDVNFSEEGADRSYRKQLEHTAVEKGPGYLHDMLKSIDPSSAEAIHANNVKRVIRALEYHHETGQMISEHNQEQRAKGSDYNFAYFVLNRERSVIYDRINRRVDKMIEDGLIDEVQKLIASGVSPDSLAMQGLGYKEIYAYLDGRLSLEDAISLLKQSTRHFAKRQITWFKRERDVIWLNYEDFNSRQEMLDAMIRILSDKKIVDAIY